MAMETSLSEVALKSHFYTVNVVTSTGIEDMSDNDKCQLNIVFQGAAVSAQQNTHQLVHHILVVELVLDRVGHHTGMHVDTLDLLFYQTFQV